MYAEGTDFFERISGSDLIAMAEESEARPGQSGASEKPSKERPGQSGVSEILSMSVCQEDFSEDINIQKEKQQPRWRKFMAYIGPGVLVSIAFMDPGMLESALQGGALYKYELLWVILVTSIGGLVIQYLASNLGVVTGMHLAEHFRAEYPRKLNFVLWILSELAVIVADVPEVLGTAFALNLLLHIPTWGGVLLTGLSTLVLIGVQRFGMRNLEAIVALLVLTMLGSFIGELAYAKPKPTEVLKGMFVPNLSGHGAVGIAISLIGALLTPYNLFLHSALVLSRKVPRTAEGINSACRYFLVETGVALFIAFLINVAVTSVSGAVCSSPNLSPEDSDNCNNLDLNRASFLLKNVLGKTSSTIYAVALLAAGQSASITGTYAGQYIMQGFLNMKMKVWLRNFLSRSIAIVPSLIVSVIYGSSGAGKLIIISSIILSFQLPYTLIPLLKFTSSDIKMGPHKNSKLLLVVAWIVGWCIIVVNIYYLSSGFGTWLVHNSLPKIASIFIGIVVFPLMALYTVSILYLTFRRDKKVTYIAPAELAV